MSERAGIGWGGGEDRVERGGRSPGGRGDLGSGSNAGGVVWYQPQKSTKNPVKITHPHKLFSFPLREAGNGRNAFWMSTRYTLSGNIWITKNKKKFFDRFFFRNFFYFFIFFYFFYFFLNVFYSFFIQIFRKCWLNFRKIGEWLIFYHILKLGTSKKFFFF